MAFQYGMSTDEFWHGDMRLLKARHIAYTRDVSYRAWLDGRRTYEAYLIAMGNAFSKKGAKKQEYPNWEDPTKNMYKKHVERRDIEEEFRIQQAQQNAWLRNIGK